MSVIHNGIDLEMFEKDLFHFTSQEKQKIRNQLFKAKNGETIILTIAALHPRKGLKYLIKAYKEIYEQKNDTRLIIIGEGPEKNELKKLAKKLKIADHIEFLGHQENISRILKTCDIFVLPSIKEAFGLVLLEAMAAQLPIVATNVGGIPEIIEDRKTGFLVPPQDSRALAQALLMLINNKALREKIAFLGLHRAKLFDIHGMVEKTKKVYDQVKNS